MPFNLNPLLFCLLRLCTTHYAEAVTKPKLRQNTFVFEFPECSRLPSPGEAVQVDIRLTLG